LSSLDSRSSCSKLWPWLWWHYTVSPVLPCK